MVKHRGEMTENNRTFSGKSYAHQRIKKWCQKEVFYFPTGSQKTNSRNELATGMKKTDGIP